MKLRDLFHSAVRPRLTEQYGQILLQVPEIDDDIGQLSDDASAAELTSLSGLCLVLEYENAKGERSQRVVTCKELSIQAGTAYLKAYCHHRKSARTFRLDRIADIFDPQTGESLSPVQAYFSQFSPDKITNSGLSWDLSVSRRADLIALLNGLVFIARCDREFHPAEKSCLESALTSFWLRMEIAGDPDFSDIIAYAEKLSPDGEIFWLAMRRFAENPRLALVFKRHARELIEADGVIRPDEAYWSIEIEDFLSNN
ncbi:MAG: WYL domain-containing protein [Novosphingobium sp.]